MIETLDSRQQIELINLICWRIKRLTQMVDSIWIGYCMLFWFFDYCIMVSSVNIVQVIITICCLYVGVQPMALCFRVKFYPSDPLKLKEEITRFICIYILGLSSFALLVKVMPVCWWCDVSALVLIIHTAFTWVSTFSSF